MVLVKLTLKESQRDSRGYWFTFDGEVKYVTHRQVEFTKQLLSDVVDSFIEEEVDSFKVESYYPSYAQAV